MKLSVRPIKNWEEFFRETRQVSSGLIDVKIVLQRNGHRYFICPNCKTKNYFKTEEKDYFCNGCNLFGVRVGLGDLKKCLGL